MNALADIAPETGVCGFEPGENAARRRALWRAVIAEQIKLASLDAGVVRSSNFEIRAARRWVRSADFDTCCALADVDADGLRSHILRELANRGIVL